MSLEDVSDKLDVRLRKDVKLLGSILGHTIEKHSGQSQKTKGKDRGQRQRPKTKVKDRGRRRRSKIEAEDEGQRQRPKTKGRDRGQR